MLTHDRKALPSYLYWPSRTCPRPRLEGAKRTGVESRLSGCCAFVYYSQSLEEGCWPPVVCPRWNAWGGGETWKAQPNETRDKRLIRNHEKLIVWHVIIWLWRVIRSLYGKYTLPRGLLFARHTSWPNHDEVINYTQSKVLWRKSGRSK